MNMLAKAIQIAATAHLNQEDKSGKPYILHPLWVMNAVRHLGEDYMIVAVLHDVLEDTDWLPNDLKNEGFSTDIITALSLLIHVHSDPYEEYIKKLSFHPIAREIKLRDLEHNSRITRLKGLRKKDFDRLEKYHKAYTYLLE